MYKKSDKSVWSGRNDAIDGELGLRFHQVIKTIDLENTGLPKLDKTTKGVVLLGFCCDEGVRRNQGRVGAAMGPAEIRRALCNMAFHFNREKYSVMDGGDVLCLNEKMEEAQEMLASFMQHIILSGYVPVVLGGGHEVAYGSYMGIPRKMQQTMGIINIDAHFDLRIPDKKGSSGTPFYQIALQQKEQGNAFRYCCIGIQDYANTKALFTRAKELNVVSIRRDEIPEKNDPILKNFMDDAGYIMLTICMDAFDIAIAPGVSAPNINGLLAGQGKSYIDQIMKSGRVVNCDIAEMNPVYDENKKTARLAAYLVYQMIKGVFKT